MTELAFGDEKFVTLRKPDLRLELDLPSPTIKADTPETELTVFPVQGTRGEPGPPGPPGENVGDIPDLTALFENGLL